MKLLTHSLIGNWMPLAFIAIFAFSGCQKEIPDVAKQYNPPKITSSESGDLATDWYTLQLDIIRKSNPTLSPVLLNRLFGYTGIGLYESVRPGIDKSVSLSTLLYQMPPMPQEESNQDYSWAISANAAMAKLTNYFYPPAVVALNKTRIDSIENANNNLLQLNIEPAVFARSQAFGQSIAEAIIAWSKTDNAVFANTGYVPPVFPGAWIPTPPLFGGAAAPYYGNTRPLLLGNLQSLTPAFPIEYSEVKGCDFYKMAKDVYDISKTLTEEQRNIALYWNDSGLGSLTPPGHNMSILTQILSQKNCNLETAALAYAKTGIALYDAILVCWKSKYTHNLIRPVSYVQKVIDPLWLPLIGTPPHPEYPAAHSFVTGAFMTTMTGIFGDNYAFTDNTYQLNFGGPRSFSSFNVAASEAGESRRYGGIHYTPSITAGLKYGREIGARVSNLQLKE